MGDTKTLTLTEFLLARIADDEAVAERLRFKNEGDPWGWQPHAYRLETCDKRRVDYTPARVVAECDAKRRILDALEDERQRKDIYNRDFDLGLLTTDGDLRARISCNARWAGLEVAVRALVTVYVDHPDYRAEWD